MGRRKIEERAIRTIQRSKGTYSISLPIEVVRALKWRERQKVVVTKHGRGMRIIDWTP